MPAIVHPAGEVVISMRPVSVFANGPECELEQLRGDLHGRWRQATRAVMVLLSLHGLPPSQIAALLDCHPVTVRRWISRFSSEGAAGLAEDETHLNLLPHVRASWTPRGARPQIPTPGKNRQVTVFGAIEVSSGRWVCRLGRRCAADFIALLGMLAEAFPHAPVIVVICDNDSVHHARAVARYLQEHRRLEVLYGARYSPHDNPAERIWAALKNYVANTAVSWPGRLRQIHSFFRARSPDQMLATAAPWTSPWLPPGYEQNFWNAALGIEVKGVRVSAAGGFDTDTWKSTGIGYSVDVSSDAPADKIAHLLEVVDEVAEIPRALRAGATVRRAT